jgi:hypothetical protein
MTMARAITARRTNKVKRLGQKTFRNSAGGTTWRDALVEMPRECRTSVGTRVRMLYR